MRSISLFVLTFIAAAFFVACGEQTGNAPAKNTNAANANAAKPAAAAPTKDAIVALEKSSWEAWKNKDYKFFEGFYSDKYVGFGNGKRIDKATSIKMFEDSKTEVKSYSLSDEMMTSLGADAALLTFKAAQDYTVAGKPGPKEVWAASVYVRNGEKWQCAYYGETPVVDPKAPKPAAPTVKKDENVAKPTETKPDAVTEALLTAERKAWEDWKNKNAKGLDEWAAKDLVTFSANQRTDRAASLKRWNEEPCEIKSSTLTEPLSVSLSGDLALLTFKASIDGKCNGQPVPTEWFTTVYVKEGGAWKAVFTGSSPAS